MPELKANFKSAIATGAADSTQGTFRQAAEKDSLAGYAPQTAETKKRPAGISSGAF